ncbi:MAG: PKD domain-containing protein [Chitinophagales bacterium]
MLFVNYMSFPYLFLIAFFSGFLLMPTALSAQHNHEQCGTMHADSVLRQKHNLPSLKDFEQWLAPKIANRQNQRNSLGRFSGPDVYTLPVIVHVVHNGDPVGSNENISAAQVYSQIDVLNEDFRRLNPDTGNAPANFQAVASDVGIEFCLAQIDPSGNVLSEPGINRYNGGQATWGSTNDIDNNLKPATIWNPDQYFNIWVVDFGNTGLLGYAQFPSLSGLGGMPGNGGPANSDGIVCLYRAFGTTGNVSAPSNGGRTATHEAGHWLGLRHIWGDGGCGTDDFCADTPESDDSNRGCPTTVNCGTQDMVQNYMDYTNDACMNIFTEDQVARMRTVMLNSPRRGILANSMVCQALDQYTLSGQVRDASTLNGIANAEVLIDGSFDYNVTADALGNFSIDVFEGTYDIYAGKWSYVTNVNTGISVLANTGPVYIDLETGWYDDFLFDFNWTESGNATTGNWERGAPIGTDFNGEPCNSGSDVANDYGDQAFVTGNGGGNAGTDDVDDGTTTLTSPVFDLSSYSEPFISYYRWFYNSGGTGTPNDSLIVRLTNGVNTEVIDLLDVNSPNSNQWNFNEIKVSDYMAPTANMQLIVEAFDKPSVGHLVEAGLDLFKVVDSVINQNAPPVTNFGAAPRTICAGDTVQFTDLSSNTPTAWNWTFQGGNPASSSAENPAVIYNSPGVYEVSLTASNTYGQDTKTESAYITVEGVSADFTANITDGCPGITVQFSDLSTCDVISYNWNFPGGTPVTSTDPNPVVTYNSVGDFDVSLTVNGPNSFDTHTEFDFISIGTGMVNVFFEDFESESFATNNWTIDNPDNAITWDIYSVDGTQSGTFAAGINFYSYNNAIGAEDGLITPVLNLGNIINTELNFDHAFRRYSQNQQDSLKILVSTDGGNTYPNIVFARAEDGTGSFATNATTTADFYPSATDDWCFGGTIGASCFTVDLSAFDQMNNVRLKFLSVNDYGNNLYLDNIDVSGECTAIDLSPIADFTSNVTEVCEGGTVDFTDISQKNPDTWNWSFPGGTPNSSSSQNPSVSYNTPGNYPVTLAVSNPDGSDTTTVSGYITVYESPSAIVSGDEPLCFGNTNGTVSVNASGGTAPYTYEWNSGETTGTITAVGAGNFLVTVTDANNCTASDSYTLSQPDSLTLNISGNAAYCGNSNGSASVQVSGGTAPYVYSWSTGDNTASLDFLSGGNYSVTVTDNNNCSKTATITIQDIQVNLNLDLLVTPLTCNNGSDAALDLNVSGGAAPYHYNWNTGDSTASISNLGAGAFAVTVRDSNFCTADTSVSISNPAGLNVNAQTTDASCGNSDGSITVNVSGGTSPYDFDWSNGDTSATISNLASGNYELTITDAQSCSEIYSYSINNVGGPSVQASIDSISCNGSADGNISLSVSGGTAPYSFDWSTNATDSFINNLSAGTYSVTVSDQNNCNTIRTYLLNNPDPIQLNEQITNSACDTADGAINLVVQNGTAPYQASWSNGANGLSVNNLPAGNYTVTVTDANTCEQTASYSVATLSGPSVQLTLVDVDCNSAASGAASLNPSGSGPFQYLWSNGNTDSINSNLSEGVYSFTVTDANGCEKADTFNISEPQPIQVNATISDATCGQSDASITVNVTGGTSPYTYLWSTGQVSKTISNLQSGNYELTVTDAMGCTRFRSYNVNDAGGANLIAVKTDVSCSGASDGSIDLSLSGGVPPYNYNWSNGSSSQDISGLSPGSYSVTVTDAAGCSSVASSIIRSPDPLSIGFSIKNVQCGEKLGEVIPQVSGGSGSYNFNWSTGADDSVFVEVAGTYELTVTDDNLCTLLDTLMIEELNLDIDLQIAADSGQSNGSVLVDVNGGTPPYSYTWLDTTLSGNSASDLAAGTYVLIVKDSLACDARVEIEIPLFSSIGMPTGQADIHLDLYPNPNSGDFVVKLQPLNEALQFEMYNTLGKLLNAGQINAGSSTYNFNYRHAAAGIYFLRFRNAEIDIVRKVIISD